MPSGVRTAYYALKEFRQKGRVIKKGERVMSIDSKLIKYYLERGFIEKKVERLNKPNA
jgi:hypothetical protein